MSEPVNFAECRLLLLVIDFKIIFYMPQEKKLNSFRSQRAGKYDDFISSSRKIFVGIWGVEVGEKKNQQL